MDIINHLQVYLEELDEIGNHIDDFHAQSKVANLGQKVKELIEAINEFES